MHIAVGWQLQHSRLTCAPLLRSQRASRRNWRVSAAQWVDVHSAKKLLDMSNFLVVDIRPFKEYDREHIVKPAKACASVPFLSDKGAFLTAAATKVGYGRSRGLLVLSANGGDDASTAADFLESEGYEMVRAVEGGYGTFAYIRG